MVDSDSNSVLIRSYFDNKDNKLLPGDLVNVDLYIGKAQNVILLPSEAVVYNNNKTFIFTVDQNNIAHKQDVTLGKEVGEDNIVILSGVKAGDHVVFAGGNKLHDGEKVIISKDSTTK